MFFDSGGRPNQKTLCFVHGMGGNMTHFEYLAPPLQADGWRVCGLDLPGFGLSGKPHREYTISYLSGAVLALLDLDAAQLAATAKRLPGAPPLTIAADVTDEAAVDDAFARIAAAHGRIDVLVNNVGGSRNQKLWEMTAEAWDFTIRLNLRSAFLCTRAAVRLMMRQSGGTIVCMSSGVREGTPWTAHHVGGAAYSAAKAGIHGFIRMPRWSSPSSASGSTQWHLARSKPSGPRACSRSCAKPASTARTGSSRCVGSVSRARLPMPCCF